jgi:hypothetical protein
MGNYLLFFLFFRVGEEEEDQRPPSSRHLITSLLARSQNLAPKCISSVFPCLS